MRIRKNVKLTPSIIWSTAASPSSPNPPDELLQAHVCLVNRSPWDVPSPPSGGGNLYRRHQQPFSSSDQEGEDDDDSLDNKMNSDSLKEESTPADYSHPSLAESIGLSLDQDKPAAIVDGDSGATTRKKMDDDADNNDDNEEVAAPAAPPKRRGRPRKASQHPSHTLNPQDYYSYAGFGTNAISKGRIMAARSNNNSRKNIKHPPHEITRGSTAGVSSTSSSSHQILYHGNEDDGPVAGYIEDDDDEEDDRVGVERKRVRKPIKARSLKSIIS